MKLLSLRCLNGIKLYVGLLLLIVLFLVGCTEQSGSTGQGGSIESPQGLIPDPGEPQLVEEPEAPILETIPSESVSAGPIEVFGYGDFWGEVGTPFSLKFETEGGLPPYHFQLDTLGGFPPMGLILDINGKLSGTPRAPGTSTFRVCAVDTAGKSTCDTFTIVINPAGVEISVTGKSCDNPEAEGNSVAYEMAITGTAKGPVGATLEVTTEFLREPAPTWTKFNCGSWSAYLAPGIKRPESHPSICQREAGQPEQTQWTFKDPVFEDVPEDHVTYPGFYFKISTPVSEKSTELLRCP